jgi:hypothetical protein
VLIREGRTFYNLSLVIPFDDFFYVFLSTCLLMCLALTMRLNVVLRAAGVIAFSPAGEAVPVLQASLMVTFGYCL